MQSKSEVRVFQTKPVQCKFIGIVLGAWGKKDKKQPTADEDTGLTNYDIT